MNCPACSHENPATNRFCGGCGAELAGGRQSAADGSSPLRTADPADDPRAYTPRHLAEKILGSRAALAGERKQVTVLFADVKGSMELAERVDPEQWHGIMDRFFQILAAGVHRFEGTVNQYTGDGIMALFGAPIAHEDHAQRACGAALHLRGQVQRYADELRTQRGLGFAVRMGLNSGDVVVGRIGDDLRMDYTAIGHTVGLAQRMEQLAAPGKPLLTQHTAKLVMGLFALRDLGPSRVRGASEPLRLYELEGEGALRTRFDVARARGLSRFVGRADEMAVLEAALERARAGTGQIVGIVAEPGVGKSRLCHEFVERCRARGIRIVQAQGVAHGKTIPLLPWMELMRNAFGITAQDDDDMVRQKIAGQTLLPNPELYEALPVMFEFLGVGDPARPAPRLTPEAMQRELVQFQRNAMQSRASRGDFAIYLLEDLHWFDGASDAMLATLGDLIPHTPTLALCTFRPGYQAAWMQSAHYRQLALRSLGAEAVAELLRNLLGDDPTVAPLVQPLLERTGGNPFFIEEVVQALVEADSLVGTKGAYRLVRPVEELAIPPTVHALLAARIDRLPEREKAVLQSAAVIGRELPEAVLRRITELPESALASAVQRLLDAELLYQTALYPEVEYAFKHPLTQEVAYRSQLAERRAGVHATVARTIEALYPDKLDERAALLAYHWEQAGEPRRAALWHWRAADWTFARDRAEMMRHWRHVRTLLAGVPEDRETLELGVLARRHLIYNAHIVGAADDDVGALFAEGMEMTERLGDPSLRVRLLTGYGNMRYAAGAIEEALAHLRDGVRLADQSGSDFLRFIARLPLAAVLSSVGPLGEALALSHEAEVFGAGTPELDGEVGDNPYGFLLAQRLMALTHLGRFGEAQRAAEQGFALARARGDREVLNALHNGSATLAVMMGEAEQALRHGEQAVELAEAGGTTLARVLAFGALGRARLACGRWREAAEALDASFALAREHRTASTADIANLAALAEAHLGSGDLPGAREAAATALATSRRLRLAVQEIRALLTYARVLLATAAAGDAAAIDAALRAAATLVTSTEARGFTPFIHLERAHLAGLAGDATEHRRELGEAFRIFTEMGAPIRAEQVQQELGGGL